MDLACHVNGDADLLPWWFAHYTSLGVTAFHMVVHGPPSENAALYRLAGSYPVHVRDAYEGPFLSEEKARRLNGVLATLRARWVLLADSDEFVEVPGADLAAVTRSIGRLGANALYAPMVQRLAPDGRLDTPSPEGDPFREMPLCAPDLYRAMGVRAAVAKFPLFLNLPTTLVNGGNHLPPSGAGTVLCGARGVTHHFKWRRTTLDRLEARAQSAHTWRHESAAYLTYLREHGARLPTAGAFPYSRAELFRRGLLRRPGARAYLGLGLERLAPWLPERARAATRRVAAGILGRAHPRPL